MSYKKVKTVFVFGKPKCIYMKPRGTLEYVKSNGEMLLLSAYIKKAKKKEAMKALASKMAKKSKAKMGLKKKPIYGGFFNEEEAKEAKEAEEIEYVMEESDAPMSGGQGFEDLVSKDNIEKLMSYLKTTGGKKAKKPKGKKPKAAAGVKAKKPKSKKPKGKAKRGGEGLNIGDAVYND
jgi:hypothetical protein